MGPCSQAGAHAERRATQAQTAAQGPDEPACLSMPQGKVSVRREYPPSLRALHGVSSETQHRNNRVALLPAKTDGLGIGCPPRVPTAPPDRRSRTESYARPAATPK